MVSLVLIVVQMTAFVLFPTQTREQRAALLCGQGQASEDSRFIHLHDRAKLRDSESPVPVGSASPVEGHLSGLGSLVRLVQVLPVDMHMALQPPRSN